MLKLLPKVSKKPESSIIYIGNVVFTYTAIPFKASKYYSGNQPHLHPTFHPYQEENVD